MQTTAAATSPRPVSTPNGWPVELLAAAIERDLKKKMDTLAVQLRCNYEARMEGRISEAQYRMSRRDLVWQYKQARDAHNVIAGDYEPAEFWGARDD